MSRAKILNDLAWLVGGSAPRNREELIRLLKMSGEFSQLLAGGEVTMLNNVIGLPDTRVEDVMVPHGRVDWLQLDDTHAEVIAKVTATRHSRYPVMDTDKETVAGILHVKRLVGIEAQPDEMILATDILQVARVVPESKRLDAMLREFQHYRVHMMIVANEAGQPSGAVTIEDVLERIVGAIHDEFDTQENFQSPIRPTGERERWTMDGDTPLEKFNERFKLDIDVSRFDTVNGWISNQIGRLPKIGDVVTEGSLTLRITQTDQRRVLAVEVSRNPDGGKQQPQP